MIASFFWNNPEPDGLKTAVSPLLRSLQSSDRKPGAADDENEEPEEDPIEKLARELDFSKEQVEGTSQLMTLRLTTNDGAVP